MHFLRFILPFVLFFAVASQANHSECRNEIYLEGLRTGYSAKIAALTKTTDPEVRTKLETTITWIKDEYERLTGLLMVGSTPPNAEVPDQLTPPVSLMRTSPDGKFAVWADSSRQNLKVVLILSGHELYEINVASGEFVDAIFISDDELATIDTEGRLVIWLLSHGRAKLTFQSTTGVPGAQTLGISGDRLHLALGGEEAIAVWNLKFKKQAYLLLLPGESVSKVAIDAGARNILYINHQQRAVLRTVTNQTRRELDVGRNNLVKDIAIVSNNQERKVFVLAEHGLLTLEDFRAEARRYLVFDGFLGDHLLLRRRQPPVIVGADPDRLRNLIAYVDETFSELVEINKLEGLFPGISHATCVSDTRFLAASATRSLLKSYRLTTTESRPKK